MKTITLKPKIIVLCPVQNEEWILHRFLEATSCFADHIIIADQQSTDRSREICAEFPKVILIDNPSERYDEFSRQKLLIDEARKIEGPRLLLALDADEFFSANLFTSIEWDTMLSASPGTIIAGTWVDLWKSPLNFNPRSYVVPGRWANFGYVDDGAEHTGKLIHGTRIPHPLGHAVLRFNQIIIMHFQLADFDRALSKNRWYLCFERLQNSERGPTELHRHYSRNISENHLIYPILPCPSEWFDGWMKRGIDMTTITHDPHYRWDWEVLRLFEKHSEYTFRHENIWYVDWEQIRQEGIQLNIPGLPQRPVKDPRSMTDIWATKLRRRTQNTWWQRWADILLRIAKI